MPKKREFVNLIAEKVTAKYIRMGETLKYITRFDYPRIYGWYVRVPDENGVLFNTWFGDGGKDASMADIEQSLVEAIIHRDNMCLQLGIPISECRLTRIVKNKTGYFGLYDYDSREKKYRAGEWRFYNCKGVRATHFTFDGSRIIKNVRINKNMTRQKAIQKLIKWLKEKDLKKYGMEIKRKVKN